MSVTQALRAPRVKESPEEVLVLGRLDEIRDFYLVDDPKRTPDQVLETAFCYRGEPKKYAIRPDSEIAVYLHELLVHVRKHHASDTAFRVDFKDARYRANRTALAVRGPVLNLRRLPTTCPRLEDLSLPKFWQDFFLLEQLRDGGLILMAAVMGKGKSTTMAAMVKSRLEKYAGFGLAIEEPPELPLDGAHGDGECVQVPVDPTLPHELGYAEAIRNAMRSYPAVSEGGSIMLVGEVRDAATAVQLLNASINGTLVITTTHAGSIKKAVQRIAALAAQKMGEDLARDVLASALRIAVHQDLRLLPGVSGWKRGKLFGDVLYSRGDTHAVAANIREGKYPHLEQQIVQQRTALSKMSSTRSFQEILSEL